MPVRLRATLTGLRGFTVSVAPLPPGVEAAGLKRTAIQSAVVSTLKKAGVPVYPTTSANAALSTRPANVESLLVTVSVQKAISSTDYTVIVFTEVYQDVMIRRDGSKNAMIIRLPTWRKVDFGVLGRDKLPGVVARAQDAAVQLAADYASANKERSF